MFIPALDENNGLFAGKRPNIEKRSTRSFSELLGLLGASLSFSERLRDSRSFSDPLGASGSFSEPFGTSLNFSELLRVASLHKNVICPMGHWINTLKANLACPVASNLSRHWTSQQVTLQDHECELCLRAAVLEASKREAAKLGC